MLANVIQVDAVLSGTPKPSAFPAQPPGQGANTFASTLRTAESNGSPVLPRSQAEAAAVGARAKFTEKDLVKNSKIPASGQVPLAIKSVPVEDAIPVLVLTANLNTVPASPVETAASLAGKGPIPPPMLSSRSDNANGLAAGADSAKQDTLIGSTSQVQKKPSTQTSTTSFEPGFTDEVDTGKETPVDVAASSLSTAVPVKQFVSLVVDEARPPLTPPDASETGKPSSNVAAEPDVIRQESPSSLPSIPARADRPAQTLSPPIVDAAGTPGNGDSQLVASTPSPSGMPLPAVDPASGTASAFAVVRQSMSNGKSQAGSSDLRSVPTIPAAAGAPPRATDPTGGSANAVAVNPSATDGKPHLGNSGEQGSLAALASSITASRVTFSAEVLKPNLFHAATAMKAGDTVAPADNRVREAPAVPVSSNQESTRSKPGDSSSSATDANAQSLPSGAAAATPVSQPNIGDQPGTPAAAANVLAPVSPAANQDSASGGALLPATERQSPAEPAPTALPAAGAVEVARLVAGVAQSEMHIGLRTQAFGSVEVHTVVRDSQVGLTVGSERGDLRALLAPEVSGLQTTFRQQDLRFDNIRFLETSAGTTAGFSGGADSQPRSSSQQHSSLAEVFSIHSPPENPAELDISAGSPARLNVHA